MSKEVTVTMVKGLKLQVLTACFLFGCIASSASSDIYFMGRSSGSQITFDVIHPSPMDQFGGIGVNVQIPDSLIVTASIQDMLSKPVFDFGSKLLPEGRYTFSWLYDDSTGARVKAGQYIFCLDVRSNSFNPALVLSCRQAFLAFAGQ